MPKQSDIVGSQNNPTGEETGGFLAGTREIFESATSGINDAGDAVDDFLGLGPGERKPILRSSQLTHRTFGLDQPKHVTPYLGFQYFIRVNYNGALKDFVEKYFSDQPFFSNNTYVKSVTLPSISIDSEIFNEYNRKRISQTKLEFEPVDITFHDIVNGSTLKLWQMYYQYYFADGRYKTNSIRNAPVNPIDFEERRFGYDIGTGQDRVNDIRYLYKSIEIFQIANGNFNKVTLYNPRIVDFKHDTMDYSSNDTVEISYTFDYEWAEYEFINKNSNNVKQDIEQEEPDIAEYLANSNFLEYQEFQGNANEKEEGYPDGILGDIEEIVDTVQTGIETVEAAKGFARNIAGKVQSVSALGNQIQKEVLGVDEPPFPLPDVRGFTSEIDNIPTNYPDVRRVRKGGN